MLNGAGTISGGSMCVGDDSDANPDLPSMDINNTFTIADGASATPFSCTSGPRVQVNAPNGHLVKASAGTTTLNMMVDNDDTLTVQAGQLVLQGGTGGETSAGAYIANAGATLQLGTCCVDPFPSGPTGRIGGPGTVVVSGLPTLAAGATLDPANCSIWSSAGSPSTAAPRSRCPP